MAGVTAASSLTAALKTQAMPVLQEAVFRNNEVFNLFAHDTMTGGATYNVKMNSGVNDSVSTYTEGQAIGDPGSQTYSTAAWPMAYYKAVAQVTGHARDYLRNDSPEAAFFPQIMLEIQKAMEDCVDLASTDMLSTGTTAPVGIQAIVDDTSDVAGLTRATDTWFASSENAIAGSVLAITDLDIIQQDCMDADNAAKPDLWLTSHKQVRTAAALGWRPTTAFSTPIVRQDTPFGGGIDIGFNPMTMSWAGFPVIPVRDLTNSIWLLLQHDTWRIVTMREWDVVELAKTDDSDKWLITGAFGLACLNPMKNGKVTGA